MTEALIDYLSHFQYLGLFAVLLLCGMGLPLPEDVVLVTGGYFAYMGYTRLIPTIITLYVGALTGDSILYWIGHRFGPDIISHRRLTWLFTPKRIQEINHYFHRYGNLTLFIARFLVGLRAPIFLSAGAFKIPYKKMLLFDGSAALISIPLITYLAYRFGGELDQFLVWLRRAEHVLIVVVAVVIAFFVFRFLTRRRKKAVMMEPKELDLPRGDES